MRRLHPDLSLTLAALGTVAALCALSTLLAPGTVAVAETPLHEGERVSVTARVLSVAEGAHGRRLVVADDHARLTALAAPGSGPKPGDIIRLVGIVARLDDGPGISAESIEIVQPAGIQPLTPADLSRAPAAFDGARVLVRGEARSGDLVGGGARIRTSGATPPPSPGPWLALGDFSYHSDKAAYILKVETWSSPS